MRILRSSLYADPLSPPLTTVARECDLVDTLESARLQLHTPGALVVHEIFDMEGEPGILEATSGAMDRWSTASREQEQHQALLYHWTISQWGPPLRDGGMVLMDKPAPLSREEICAVFEQLAEHPDYRGFTIVSHTRDGEPVKLANGRIVDDT